MLQKIMKFKVFKNNFSYSRFHLHRTSQNSLRKKVYLLERRKEYMLSYSLNITYYSCCGSSFEKSDHHAILHMTFENSKKNHILFQRNYAGLSGTAILQEFVIWTVIVNARLLWMISTAFVFTGIIPVNVHLDFFF